MAENYVGWTEQFFDETLWEVKDRYINLSQLGRGAYGSVCSAVDTFTSERLKKEIYVAIKKLARPFETSVHAKRAYREIRLLKHVTHDNVIKLLDIFTRAETAENFNDIYLVTNLMGTDLNNVIRTQELTDQQIMFFTYQILRGLKYLHSSNIIHRDLKPSNLTVNENCELKIIDFGLARSEREEMTGYVATRWYRAPEIMLRWMRYTNAVDMWSVGCILVEMFTHKALFQGSDHVNQLKVILDIVGFPDVTLLNEINEDARTFLERMERPTRVDFPRFFSQIKTPHAVDLIERLLVLNPNHRITAYQALEHQYVADFHDPDDEPEGQYFNDQYENEEYSIIEWKARILNEMQTFVPPEIVEDN